MPPAPRPIRELFEARVRREKDGCWPWLGTLRPDGYGVLGPQSKAMLAHRISYELNVGPIPEGLTIDHLCRNRGCVNPAHLEAVTRGENTRRGLMLRTTNHQREKTHCPQGHPYDDENTLVTKAGKRNCRKCKRKREREATAKKRVGDGREAYNAYCREWRKKRRAERDARPAP